MAKLSFLKAEKSNLTRIGIFAIGLAIITSFSGCDDTVTKKAGGKVLVDGKPVTTGTIKFYPLKDGKPYGRPSTAIINEDGTFTLTYKVAGDGLPPGKYKVAIISDVFKGQQQKKTTEESDDGMDVAARGKLVHVVPTQYNDIKTSPLTEEVKEDGDVQEFIYDIPSK